MLPPSRNYRMLCGFAVGNEPATARKDGTAAGNRKACAFLHATVGHPSIPANFSDWRGDSHIDMIISCPSCGASFNVKLEALGSSGRKVKCGKCKHQWHALPDGSAAAEPSDRGVASAPRPPGSAVPAEQAGRAGADPAVKSGDGDNPNFDTPRSEPAPAAPPEQVAAPTPETKPQAVAPSETIAAEPTAGDETDIGLAADAGDEPRPEQDVPATPPPFPFGQTRAIEDEAPHGEADDASDPEPPPDNAAEPAGRGLARRITLAALAAAAAIIILVGGAIFLQPQITSIVPAAASLYAKMGLQTDTLGLGLKIIEPVPRKLIEGDNEILEVVGEIRNETKQPLQIPVMQARLLDGDGAPLEVWHFRAEKPQIAPGESVQYKTEFRNPPNRAERLDITFTRQAPATDAHPQATGERPPLKKLQREKATPAR